MAGFHLAQLNIGRIKYPTDDPRMAGFMDQLDEINEVADASPGFVWRLQTDDGDATAIRAFPDDDLLVNLSVWESVADLQNYVYRTDHLRLLRQRRDWFDTMGGAVLALWWIPAGHIPSLAEAKERLASVDASGPTPFAFTFRTTFPPPTAED